MTDREAVILARSWVRNRREVRKHLVALARELNPKPNWTENLDENGRETDLGRTLRKLWEYPSDLSEERLLNLIIDTWPEDQL